MLQAGMYAPTGSGKQSPRIVAHSERRGHRAAEKNERRPFGQSGGGPLLRRSYRGGGAGGPELPPPYLYDGSCVMDNLMNAAEAVGLAPAGSTGPERNLKATRARPCSGSGGLEGDYEGIGHCLAGYRAGERPDLRPGKRTILFG